MPVSFDIELYFTENNLGMHLVTFCPLENIYYFE